MTGRLPGRIRLGTRSSTLARWQTGYVADRIREAVPDLQIEEAALDTVGDQRHEALLADLGGAAFSAEIERALLKGTVRAAVHSLKDLPIGPAPGLIVAAILGREDPRDVLVSGESRGLGRLAPGATIGTSSPRRHAQIRARRPDVRVVPLRGNVETRLAKVADGGLDAIVLAAAGVLRLGLAERVTEYLPLDDFVPAPGQGALAVQCREADTAMMRVLEQIEDAGVRAAVTAERSFLACLGGGCSLPVGAVATSQAGLLLLRGFVGSKDGARCIRISAAGRQPEELGQELADQAFAQGAKGLLS